MQIIPSRISFITVCEGCLSMISTSLHTIRVERQVVPKNKIKDITLGCSLAKFQYLFFKDKIVKKILSRKKANKK